MPIVTIPSFFSPLAGAIAIGLKLNVGYQQQVDDINSIVGLGDENGAAAGYRHHEFTMMNRHLSAISQMDDKGLERLGIMKVANLVNRYNFVSVCITSPNIGSMATRCQLKRVLWLRCRERPQLWV